MIQAFTMHRSTRHQKNLLPPLDSMSIRQWIIAKVLVSMVYTSHQRVIRILGVKIHRTDVNLWWPLFLGDSGPWQYCLLSAAHGLTQVNRTNFGKEINTQSDSSEDYQPIGTTVEDQMDFMLYNSPQVPSPPLFMYVVLTPSVPSPLFFTSVV